MSTKTCGFPYENYMGKRCIFNASPLCGDGGSRTQRQTAKNRINTILSHIRVHKRVHRIKNKGRYLAYTKHRPFTGGSPCAATPLPLPLFKPYANRFHAFRRACRSALHALSDCGCVAVCLDMSLEMDGFSRVVFLHPYADSF